MTSEFIIPLSIAIGSANDANAPAIGWASIMPGGLITASTQETANPAANVADGLTWDFWRPVSGDTAAWLAVDVTYPALVDYAGIAAHNLGSIGATITVQAWIDGVWQDVHEIVPEDDRPIMALFSETEASQWRIALSGYTGQPSVGIVNIGQAMRLQRNIYVGHSPINLSRNTNIKPNISMGGQFLGRSIQRRGAETSIVIGNLTPEWYRETFDPFVQYARTGAFFWSWRPSDYENEVGYVWTTDDIAPSNQRNNGMMQVSFRVEGITE